jgi:putative Ca2+/H+ antiporter (TMEM165/GDT1 family)
MKKTNNVNTFIEFEILTLLTGVTTVILLNTVFAKTMQNKYQSDYIPALLGLSVAIITTFIAFICVMLARHEIDLENTNKETQEDRGLFKKIMLLDFGCLTINPSKSVEPAHQS